MYKCILFDMDGTLVNTYEGIYNSYQFAFEKMNLKFEKEKFVGAVIGAPLLSVFENVVGLSKDKAFEAMKHYRYYYSQKGKDEACLYPMMKECLEQLKNAGYLLGVATLKRENFALQILKDLNIYNYFNVICGIDDNDSLSKTDLLNMAMDKLKVSPKETILVGDSEYDLLGAEEATIDFMAVLYGFGFKNDKDITLSRCKYVVENVHGIIEMFQ